MRRMALVSILAVSLAACGGAEGDPDPTPPPAASTDAPADPGTAGDDPGGDDAAGRVPRACLDIDVVVSITGLDVTQGGVSDNTGQADGIACSYVDIEVLAEQQKVYWSSDRFLTDPVTGFTPVDGLGVYAEYEADDGSAQLLVLLDAEGLDIQVRPALSAEVMVELARAILAQAG